MYWQPPSFLPLQLKDFLLLSDIPVARGLLVVALSLGCPSIPLFPFVENLEDSGAEGLGTGKQNGTVLPPPLSPLNCELPTTDLSLKEPQDPEDH